MNYELYGNMRRCKIYSLAAHEVHLRCTRHVLSLMGGWGVSYWSRDALLLSWLQGSACCSAPNKRTVHLVHFIL